MPGRIAVAGDVVAGSVGVRLWRCSLGRGKLNMGLHCRADCPIVYSTVEGIIPAGNGDGKEGDE